MSGAGFIGNARGRSSLYSQCVLQCFTGGQVASSRLSEPLCVSEPHTGTQWMSLCHSQLRDNLLTAANWPLLVINHFYFNAT